MKLKGFKTESGDLALGSRHVWGELITESFDADDVLITGRITKLLKMDKVIVLATCKTQL